MSRAYARMAGSFDEAMAIRDIALPPANEAFRFTRRAFQSGDLALIDVTRCRAHLMELRTEYLDALTGYHLAVTEIAGLIGRPLADLGPVQIQIPTTMPETNDEDPNHPGRVPAARRLEYGRSCSTALVGTRNTRRQASCNR